ncbi:MAG: tetratricopeptide repeat protein [Elusimicrobia bacterium]|nr:tetratricopeptide repeat protein [Elusimicrobiota bacterium]
MKTCPEEALIIFAITLAVYRPTAIQAETWQSLRMEASAVMGELKYQHGDFSGARETFRDSLRSSTMLMNPQDQVMALDLYRSAELAARERNYKAAREHLEILLSRYPDSPWTLKGRALLDQLAPDLDKKPQPSLEEPLEASETPEPLLGRIQAAVKQGAAEEALQLCREFAGNFPAHRAKDEIRVLAAALHLRLGRAAQAAKILEFAARQSPSPELKAQARYLLGASLFALGRHQELLEALPLPGHGELSSQWTASALLWRAAAEEKLGMDGAAEEHYELVLRLSTSSSAKAYAWAAVARRRERRGDIPGAQAALAAAAHEAKAAGLAELTPPLELAEAHLLYGRRRLAEAGARYLAFAGKHPAHPQASLALYQAGLSLKRLGRLQEAVAAFEELLEKNRDSVYAAETHLQLGQIYTEMRSSEQAVAEYRRMGQAGGKAGAKESLLLEAQVRYNRKDWAQAIPLYRRFLAENPADSRRGEVEELLIACYWQQDKENPDLFKLIELHPESPLAAPVRLEAAAQSYKKGDYQGAAQAWLAFLKSHPKNALSRAAWLGLAKARAKLGDKEKALAAYEKSVSGYPPSQETPGAWYQIGLLRESLGRKDEARKAYAALASQKPAKDPSRLKGLMRLGLFYELDSKADQALRLYKEIARLSPEDSPLYAAAFKRVEKLARPGGAEALLSLH